jgi:hypothetical protein
MMRRLDSGLRYSPQDVRSRPDAAAFRNHHRCQAHVRANDPCLDTELMHCARYGPILLGAFFNMILFGVRVFHSQSLGYLTKGDVDLSGAGACTGLPSHRNGIDLMVRC